MKSVLIGLLAIVSSAWHMELMSTAFPPNSALLWIVRQEGMYLTGLLSIALMSLSMLLSTRPCWHRPPTGHNRSAR